MKEQDLVPALDLINKRDALAKAAEPLAVVAGRTRGKLGGAEIAIRQSILAIEAAAAFLDEAGVRRVVECATGAAAEARKAVAEKLAELGVEA